ncbi:MAG: hypothetical protein ACRC32_25990 [Chroococcidiopsis sp.]
MANPYYTKPRIHFGDYQSISPQWSGTPQHQPKVLVPGGGHLNASAFTALSNATPITVAAAGAAAGATTIPLQSAIASAVPSGKILDFTGAGKFAKLTAAAAEGATSLTVEALPQALVAGDMAYYSMGDYLLVQSGTLVGRTYAERDAGIGYGPYATGDEEAHLLMFDVHDALTDNEAELYMAKSNNVVYENFLPNWTSLSTEIKTFIRANYNCLIGVA